MAKETATERRAREAQEAREQEQKWEAEKPMRLLRAMARANELGSNICSVFFKNEELHYSFYFSSHTSYSDRLCELSEYTMDNIEYSLDWIEAERRKEKRLKQLRSEVLSRLTEEEKEALGF